MRGGSDSQVITGRKMQMDINKMLSEEFNVNIRYLNNVINLINDGQTIPFIARYRKEMTGSMDDETLRNIYERMNYLNNLQKRKEEIISSITEQGKMTDEIMAKIDAAAMLVEVEDIYLPFKQKRRTRAQIAKEHGLEPLALFILEQNEADDPQKEAAKYISEEVEDAGAAVGGAMDIIAETVSDDADVRKDIRELFRKGAVISSKAVGEPDEADEKDVYRTYYDYSESIKKTTGYRVLALDRGEKEGRLKINVDIGENMGEEVCIKKYVINSSPCGGLVKNACIDAYSRLIYPSIEREIRAEMTEKAADGAIKVFSSNLRQLLMQPPVKGAVTLGFDPGYRNGCKTAVVDSTGKVLDTAIVYPTAPHNKVREAKEKLKSLIKKYNVTAIAIGNGTASRESESLIAEIIKEIPEKVSYMVVSEAGASVYSASKLASAEFPDYDVSLRSAVSIARRLQDPLAELVKIDPKSIGVGQYQHDMPKAKINDALSGVVEDCVNSVGVDLNTASYSLLSYVAGINSAVAKNIVAYREENGAFINRKQLMKVAKLGAKTFEQCAGFLRVPGSDNLLDNTAVHPESYAAAQDLLEKCGYTISDISSGNLGKLKERADKFGIDELAGEIGIGAPTVSDIIKELQKPGRDPRDELPPPLMRSGDIMDIADLKEGMELVGTVRNVIDFGCFVDIGVHEDGLVHISQICDRYIKSPLDVVKVGEVVKVKVLSVDTKRGRISLSMKL